MSQIGTSSSTATPAPAVSGPIASGRVRRLSHRTKRRAIALGILAGILVAVALLALDAGLSARRMLSGISASRNELIDGGNSVVTGDPSAAALYFAQAKGSAGSAVAAAGHPGIRLLGALPWIGDNIRAARAVAEASQATADAGLSMVDAANTLGWNDLSMPGATSLGDVDLSLIRAAAPKLDAVATQLDDALSLLNAAASSHLVGPVATGYNDTVTVLTHRAALADNARDLFHLLPRLLGGGGARQYLVAVESLAQPQAPGGRVGPVGVMTATDGRLTLEPMATADSALANTFVSPNVPVDAKAMLAAAAQQGIQGLDGVIVIDTAGLQDLLWAVGDINVGDLKEPLSQNNAVVALDRDVFKGTALAQATARQAALAGELLDGALTLRPSTEAFGTAMAEMVSGRHLAVYSTDPKAQALLARLGAAGIFDTSGNLLSVVMDSTGTNRTGTFVHRPVSVSVTLDGSGTAALRMVMDVTNGSPAAPPSVLLGQSFVDHPVGSFSAEASVYLPANADHITTETSTGTLTGTGKDLGVPLATAALSVKPGESTSLIVGARVKGAATHAGSGWEYVIRIVPQPSATPQPLRVLIRVPSGRSVTSASDGMEIAGTLARYEGMPDGTVTLFVRYR